MSWRHRIVVGTLVVACLMPFFGEAADTPKVGPADSTVRSAIYNEWQVYELSGAYRSAMAIEFSPGEQIENVGLGDTTAWDVADSGNILFLKPTRKTGATNAIVQTLTRDGKRRLYQFMLTATDTPTPEMMKIKFVYPAEAEAERKAAERKEAAKAQAEEALAESQAAIYTGPRNWAYAMTGTAAFAPTEAWDNGRATAFRLVGQTELPSVYAVDEDNTERLVPSHVQENLVVAHEVARRWRLRIGQQVICIWNEAYQPSSAPERGDGAAGTGLSRSIIK
jgi:type IV secretion system protein VirB9